MNKTFIGQFIAVARFAKAAALRKKCVTLLLMLAATGVGQAVFHVLISPKALAVATTFDDPDEFKTYIMTRVDSADGMSAIASETGEPISETWEFIYDENGEIICRYIWRNQSVTMIDVQWNEGQPRITTWTASSLQQGVRRIQMVNLCFVGGYLMEFLGVTLCYQRKKKWI